MGGSLDAHSVSADASADADDDNGIVLGWIDSLCVRTMVANRSVRDKLGHKSGLNGGAAAGSSEWSNVESNDDREMDSDVCAHADKARRADTGGGDNRVICARCLAEHWRMIIESSTT